MKAQIGKGFSLPGLLKRGPSEADVSRAVVAELRQQVANKTAALAERDAKLTAQAAQLASVQKERDALRTAAKDASVTVLRAKLDTETKERARLQVDMTRLQSDVRRQKEDIGKAREVAIRHGAAAYELPDDGVTSWLVNRRLDGQAEQAKADAAEREAAAKRDAANDAVRVQAWRERDVRGNR